MPPPEAAAHLTRRHAASPLLETALILVLFCVNSAWPVPDVNEAYYLGKAVHYWNPDWLQGDFFMESADTHKTFYYFFGWLSRWLPLTALTWTGRLLAWWLLAWSWRRLSYALIPRAGYAVLTAALFVSLMERCHMAGEWVVGGVEAKPFAYALVFLGLEALVRERWNCMFSLFGAAAAIHVLVGGWPAVAAAIAWLWPAVKKSPLLSKQANIGSGGTAGDLRPPPLLSLWPGLLFGLLLALPGIIPCVLLDWGADNETIRQARQIYVFERLPHHLLLSGIRPWFIARFLLLGCCWLFLVRLERKAAHRFGSDWASSPDARRLQLLRAFVIGAIVIAACGAAIHLLLYVDRSLAARLLRFYWFRLSDVALPLGVSLEGTALLAFAWRAIQGQCGAEATRRTRALSAVCWGGLATAALVVGGHFGFRVYEHLTLSQPRSHRIADYADWRAACDWVVQSGGIPPHARFFVPRLAQTFKWFTGRNEVVSWKDFPQGAREIVEWRRRIQAVYMTGETPRSKRWYEPYSKHGTAALRRLAAEYEADYAIVEQGGPPLEFDIVYDNRSFIIYRLR